LSIGQDAHIVGGKEARPNEFPWQVSLQNARGSHFCGGILINKNWVMSAAHCTVGDRPRDVRIVLGEHSRRNNDGTEQIMAVRGNMNGFLNPQPMNKNEGS
jgi:secreted trypsin-like serine protease